MYQSNSKNQKGVSLIIAILILGVVMVISLAIGVLMTRELKMATNIDQSVTAYFAAESGVEKALWEVWKGDGSIDPGDTTGSVLDDTGTWELTVEKGESPKEECLARDHSAQANFIGPEVDGGKLTLSWECVASGPGEKCCDPASIDKPQIEYALIRWQEGFFPASTIKKDVELTQKIQSGSVEIPLDLVDFDYILRFRPLYNGAYYSLQAEDSSGDPVNIPGKLEVISTGDYGKTKRSISVTFLGDVPLHGIFDYVLFSDESIIK